MTWQEMGFTKSKTGRTMCWAWITRAVVDRKCAKSRFYRQRDHTLPNSRLAGHWALWGSATQSAHRPRNLGQAVTCWNTSMSFFRFSLTCGSRSAMCVSLGFCHGASGDVFPGDTTHLFELKVQLKDSLWNEG
jgi:hypothetical protein